MPRPYRDEVELATEPVPERKSPFTPPNAVMVKGAYFPGVPDVAPLVLSPEYDYRLRLTCLDGEHEVWIIERRRATR